MAFENTRLTYPNFCLSPTDGVFCSVNHVGDTIQFRVDTSGNTFGSDFSLATSVSEIKSIEYPGPRASLAAQGNWGSDLPIFTLERDSSTQCKIREWRLNAGTTTLDLENTITKTTAGNNYFDVYDMAVEHYIEAFSAATATGTGFIKVANTVTSIEVGDRLLLGPSTDVTNLNATEWAEVTSVVLNGANYDIFIDSSTTPSKTPPLFEYQSTDDITHTEAIYLFSNIGIGNDTTKGTLYKLDPYSGTISGSHTSAIYKQNTQPSNFSAAAWSTDFDAIGFVRGSNILYTDPNTNYNVIKSQALTNINADDATLLPVYDLIFNGGAIYRLQDKITLRDNNGDKSTTTWATYNYHLDTITPYTLSIDISAEPGILAQEPSGGKNTTTLTAVVRDQFGVGLSGKQLEFFKSGETGDSFTPTNGQPAVTSSEGVTTLTYTARDYDPASAPISNVITITAKTDGSSSTAVGSAFIWDGLELLIHHTFDIDVTLIQKPTLSGSGVDPFNPATVHDDLKVVTLLKQIENVSSTVRLKGLSKFQFPGGHWTSAGEPAGSAAIIEQLADFTSDTSLEQIDEVTVDVHLDQLKEQTNDLQISQNLISRHLLAGHKDTATVDQFTFIQDFIPPFFSEKNPTNTNISGRLRPFGFNLNLSTLVFKVREISYAGDTGFIDVTSQMTVNTFDAGGGLLGLDLFYNPAEDFHHNGVVYVSIEVYDTAGTPNIILTEYWFKIIPDFKAPYITNESPAREEEEVARNTNISFDILDAGVGVDISTLEFSVNARQKTPVTTTISGGYRVTYNPPDDFFYGETVEISVKVKDASDFQNTLFDMWRFYVVGSTGPWINRDSFLPGECKEGVNRQQTNISVNVLAIDDTGLDRSSLFISIGGKERNVKIRPIIYRLN